jgi:hypothetical protein
MQEKIRGRTKTLASRVEFTNTIKRLRVSLVVNTGTRKPSKLNEMKSTCRLCHPSNPHTIYESCSKGVTSGQISHLWASHRYNAERHRLGVEGLSESLVRGSQSTFPWGMKEKQSPEEAMQQYIVVHRHPFIAVASPEWQAIFTSQGTRSPYSNPPSLRKHIMEDFQSRRALLNLGFSIVRRSLCLSIFGPVQIASRSLQSLAIRLRTIL